MTNSILTRIIQDKKQWVQQRKGTLPLASFKASVRPSQRSFYSTLRHQKEQHQCVFILECKKASPSKGVIRSEFDPASIANIYRPYATVISVLTDEQYFNGNFEYLNIVSQNTYQPILCKDFIIDEYQIYLARYHQADAILLMLSVLTDEQYRYLSNLAHKLQMGVLTEVANEEDARRAVKLKAQVIGINNRNLHDLSIDLERTKKLAPLLPDDAMIISESGIKTHQDIRKLRPHSDGFLIGSILMSEHHLEQAVRQIMFGGHKVCGLTRQSDAYAAYESGAVYGGVIFASQSPRCIQKKEAIALVKSAPLRWVGVFVNDNIRQIKSIAKQLGLFAVQLHGQEDEHYIASLKHCLDQEQLPTHIWKAYNVQSALPEMLNPLIDLHLLDHGTGGSGKSFDWKLFTSTPMSKIMVAGGLNINNLQRALNLNAYGLDFNSGLEITPGIKSKAKISEIFAAIRTY